MVRAHHFAEDRENENRMKGREKVGALKHVLPKVLTGQGISVVVRFPRASANVFGFSGSKKSIANRAIWMRKSSVWGVLAVEIDNLGPDGGMTM